MGNPQDKVDASSAPTLFVVPGNHDIWQRRQPDQLGAYHRHFLGPFPTRCEILTRSRSIILYGLDSTQNTRWRHKLARGRIPQEDLHQLQNMIELEKMADDEAKNAIRIVCFHHPLTDPQEGWFDPSMRLEDREAIAQRLLGLGIDLVLAGHLHHALTPSASGAALPAHAVIGSATQLFADEHNFFRFCRKVAFSRVLESVSH